MPKLPTVSSADLTKALEKWVLKRLVKKEIILECKTVLIAPQFFPTTS